VRSLFFRLAPGVKHNSETVRDTPTTVVSNVRFDPTIVDRYRIPISIVCPNGCQPKECSARNFLNCVLIEKGQFSYSARQSPKCAIWQNSASRVSC
jgi:hypothetical protein